MSDLKDYVTDYDAPHIFALPEDYITDMEMPRETKDNGTNENGSLLIDLCRVTGLRNANVASVMTYRWGSAHICGKMGQV